MRPETMLDIRLSAICSRNEFTREPGPVIAELLETAGTRVDVLTAAVGHWVGYYDSPERRVLVVALREAFPECGPWIEGGRARRSWQNHGTPPRR